MKKDISLAVVGVILIVGICFGLAAMRPDFKATKTTPFATVTGGTLPGKAEEDKVVMRVNGEPVTRNEFTAFVQQAPEQMQAYYASPEGRANVAQEIVKLKALEQEGKRLGVDKSPDVQTRLAMDRANVIAAFTLQKLVSTPAEARLRAEYEKEKRNFETVELSHILIAYQGGSVPAKNGSPLPVPAAMQRAQAIEAQLRAGADFAQMARAQSDDPQSGAEGGQLGAVTPGAMPPEIAAVVAPLQAGQVSQPVKSQYGIHIFKAGQRKARPFDQVKPMLESRVQRDEADAAVLRLQKAAKVDLDPAFFPKQAETPAQAPREEMQLPRSRS